MEHEQNHEAYGEGYTEGETPFPGGRLLNLELFGSQRVLERSTEVEGLGDDHVHHARHEVGDGDIGDVGGDATRRHCLIGGVIFYINLVQQIFIVFHILH